MKRRSLFGVVAGALAAGAPTVVKASDGGRFRAMWMLSALRPSGRTQLVDVFFERETEYGEEAYSVSLELTSGIASVAYGWGPLWRVPIRVGEQYSQIAVVEIPEGSRIQNIYIDVYRRAETATIRNPPPGVNVVSE